MAEQSQRISGVAERYASSLFELASADNAIDAVAKDLDQFNALIEGNDELKRLISSPVFASDDQFGAISAIVAKSGLGPLSGNFLKVVARNGRLDVLPGIMAAYHQIVARERGEVTAYVRSAHALSSAQEQELASTLSSATGKKVSTRVTVDPALLGGLVVKVGSRQIDTSLRTKLSTLKHALKEVG
ncbi:F0F1 ATP synthase subunit delta [Pseudohoeflea coraliihabitans]|uniref:ATP synthase subunit delta n=1 Tax=Pseudohoeflea coraliihabitans TaxID=2860393 RepID=A0ABS6WLF7_9HYPH|nr:F0F1 ATP synthase subunit delta [Pseudohoeflea sp. DP4N28-3]